MSVLQELELTAEHAFVGFMVVLVIFAMSVGPSLGEFARFQAEQAYEEQAQESVIKFIYDDVTITQIDMTPTTVGQNALKTIRILNPTDRTYRVTPKLKFYPFEARDCFRETLEKFVNVVPYSSIDIVIRVELLSELPLNTTIYYIFEVKEI